MALSFSLAPALFSTQSHCHPLTFPKHTHRSRIRKTTTTTPTLILAMAPDENTRPAKLVTFLGKGGSGKTLSSIFAAQHYASAGLNTCLVIHSQDSTADHLLNCKIGPSPVRCNDNLSAVRLETTKILLEPLKRLKEADARLNLTQGVLEGIVGEELGVLPGMDSIFSLFALERYLRFMGEVSRRKTEMEQFDLIVYDGISPEETLRMIGAASKARLYLRYLRNVAEKTDIGRLAGPSILRLVDDALTLTGSQSDLNGNTSAKILDPLEQMLERGASAFTDSRKFRCLLVMDPNNLSSVNSSLRYWGCAIQAGATVSGAFSFTPTRSKPEIPETVKGSFSPLPFASIPHISFDSAIDWHAVMSSSDSKNAQQALSFSSGKGNSGVESVKFDLEKKSVTLFMPGFDKSEIKLYQYRGGSELLVEAGDQRRVIRLPPKIQGKVGGAKFVDRSLVITLR